MFLSVQVLTNSEVIDNIIEATPGLAADHLAIALLRDHILLQQVTFEAELRDLQYTFFILGHLTGLANLIKTLQTNYERFK